MPRSIKSILEHALELEQRFVEFEVDAAKEVPVEEYLLRRAVIDRARCEQRLFDAVGAARAAGMSWQRIGSLIGTSAQGAQQRYRNIADAS